MIDRRRVLVSAVGGLASAGLSACRKPVDEIDRDVPQRALARVIADNDYAGDPDALIALAHQLLTRTTQTVLVTSSALNAKFSNASMNGISAEQGRLVAMELIQRLGVSAGPPVVAGSETFGISEREISAAARAIVAEAMRDDPLPLYLTCGGPLTNLAAALRIEPAIAKRLTLVWIGGAPYPDGGWEYNLATDPEAARAIVERSAVRLWQVPQNAYRQMAYSIAELDEDMRPISPFTRWLYSRFTHPPSFVDVGGSWPMGDSPLVLLTGISRESSRSHEQPARRISDDFHYVSAIDDRVITVFDTVDARLCMGDFLAVLHRNARTRV